MNARQRIRDTERTFYFHLYALSAVEPTQTAEVLRAADLLYADLGQKLDSNIGPLANNIARLPAIYLYANFVAVAKLGLIRFHPDFFSDTNLRYNQVHRYLAVSTFRQAVARGHIQVHVMPSIDSLYAYYDKWVERRKADTIRNYRAAVRTRQLVAITQLIATLDLGCGATARRSLLLVSGGRSLTKLLYSLGYACADGTVEVSRGYGFVRVCAASTSSRLQRQPFPLPRINQPFLTANE
uniref:Uncharacterized protein n=1 Tax=Mycena chlorophos TaxID=658473 RepID=A0ABQ0LE69_MYCCL|nr:predicted protein [Mycena chlorophos]